MEIIRVANGDYERYEELLLQRDHLEKEAFGYQLEYTREFGEKTIEAFRLKIDCISLKKSIAFCIASKNRGEVPDPSKLAEFLARQMASYREKLEEMIDEKNASQKGRPLSPFESSEVKRIYRRIAKILHPDISPLTEEYPELSELFQRVMVAYQCNGLKELRELEVIINKLLEEKGIDKMSIAIPNVAERITEIENEIGEILNSEPYTYKYLFADSFKMSEKHDALDKEIKEYRTYKKELEEKLRSVMGEKNG